MLAKEQHRHRAPHGGEVSRADGHPALVQAQAGLLRRRSGCAERGGAMQITVTFRHVDPTPALRATPRTRSRGWREVPAPAGRRARHPRASRSSGTSPRSRCRPTTSSMFAKEETHDLYSAIDLAVDKLEHQAQKLKAKPTRPQGRRHARALRSRRHDGRRGRAPAARPEVIAHAPRVGQADVASTKRVGAARALQRRVPRVHQRGRPARSRSSTGARTGDFGLIAGPSARDGRS